MVRRDILPNLLYHSETATDATSQLSKGTSAFISEFERVRQLHWLFAVLQVNNRHPDVKSFKALIEPHMAWRPWLRFAVTIQQPNREIWQTNSCIRDEMVQVSGQSERGFWLERI